MNKPALPLVGVVIANYNNASYVEQAIRSVAAQSFVHFRTIVVDNCSTDSSDAAIDKTLKELGDERFQYIRNDCNRGQAGAIRTGLGYLLDASFICILDSDDYLYEDFIERHIEAHLNADFPVALSYCDSHIVNGEGWLLAGTAWWFNASAGPDRCRRIDSMQIPRLNCQSEEMHFPKTGALRLNATWAPHQSSNGMSSMMLRRPFIDLVLTPTDEELSLYVDYYFSTLAALAYWNSRSSRCTICLPNAWRQQPFKRNGGRRAVQLLGEPMVVNPKFDLATHPSYAPRHQWANRKSLWTSQS
jgi:glycosyltransferase involved in cell wall biosynthesis